MLFGRHTSLYWILSGFQHIPGTHKSFSDTISVQLNVMMSRTDFEVRHASKQETWTRWEASLFFLGEPWKCMHSQATTKGFCACRQWRLGQWSFTVMCVRTCAVQHECRMTSKVGVIFSRSKAHQGGHADARDNSIIVPWREIRLCLGKLETPPSRYSAKALVLSPRSFLSVKINGTHNFGCWQAADCVLPLFLLLFICVFSRWGENGCYGSIQFCCTKTLLKCTMCVNFWIKTGSNVYPQAQRPMIRKIYWHCCINIEQWHCWIT